VPSATRRDPRVTSAATSRSGTTSGFGHQGSDQVPPVGLGTEVLTRYHQWVWALRSCCGCTETGGGGGGDTPMALGGGTSGNPPEDTHPEWGGGPAPPLHGAKPRPPRVVAQPPRVGGGAAPCPGLSQRAGGGPAWGHHRGQAREGGSKPVPSLQQPQAGRTSHSETAWEPSPRGWEGRGGYRCPCHRV